MPVALKPEIFTRHLSEIEKAASNLWRVNGCDKFNPDKALNRCHIACIMSEVGEGEKLSSPNCWNRVTCVHIIKNKNVKLFVRDCPVLRFVRVKFFFFWYQHDDPSHLYRYFHRNEHQKTLVHLAEMKIKLARI